MLTTRVLVCLLVRNGRLVKTVKFKEPTYVGDPVNAIKIYNDKEIDELVVLDISATADNKPPRLDLIHEIVDECFMPLCYGGGVKTLDQIKSILAAGVEKVSINSEAIHNPRIVEEAASIFGSQSIVVSLDVKKGLLGRHAVYTHGGRKAVKQDPVTLARRMERTGAGEILLNSIDRDGTWEGYDLDLIKRVADAVDIPIVALGGAGRAAHFAEAVRAGASACGVGSMAVYQGKGKGVLINFPTRAEIVGVLGERR